MGFQNGWRGPDIVSDGLVLYMDAGSPNSYRTDFGNTWKDMSGNGNNGTLTNGPAFNSGSGGSIMFDGVNDYSSHGYVTQLYNTKTITYNLWLKWNTLNANRIVIGNENYGSVCFGIRQRSDNSYWISPGIGVAYIIRIIPGVDTTKAHMITALTDGANASFYVNGSFISSSAYSTTFTSQATFYVGIGYADSFVEAFAGNINNVSIYNKALSAQEVLQNYNAQKSRFGL